MSYDLLVVRDLEKLFPIRRGLLGRSVGAVHAVDGVSFSIPKGKTLSLVGESGSGKTTTGRLILRLLQPTGGQVIFDGADISRYSRKQMRPLRKRMQLIFQDPYGSLNPRITIGGMLTEILRTHHICPAGAVRERVKALLARVGLPETVSDRYPHEFSGGQRQRIAIARALAAEPDLIIADEPVSALDVSIQAQILNLLQDLQKELDLTYLFIGHDLNVVRHISDIVAVMYLGRIVEMAPVDDLFEHPIHPYTQALLAAAPIPDPDLRRSRKMPPGDIPSPIHPPSGCRFHPRCPDAGPECAKREQRLIEILPEHFVACMVHGGDSEIQE